MRIPRIYQNREMAIGAKFYLDEAAARHVGTVLRLDLDDKITLFNGEGIEYPAIITETKKSKVQVRVVDTIPHDVESKLKIHLGQAISKGDRMDITLQKATELGIIAITPLFSSRSEVKLKGDRESKKMAHWQKVITSSSEQCGRTRLPVLYQPMDIHEWIRDCDTETVKGESLNPNVIKITLDHRSELGFKEGIESVLKLQTEKREQIEEKENLEKIKKIEKATKTNEMKKFPNIFLLVGPEGGLTFDEKLYAEKNNFLLLRLGPRVLRTETAGMVAIAVLQALLGDL